MGADGIARFRVAERGDHGAALARFGGAPPSGTGGRAAVGCDVSTIARGEAFLTRRGAGEPVIGLDLR